MSIERQSQSDLVEVESSKAGADDPPEVGAALLLAQTILGAENGTFGAIYQTLPLGSKGSIFSQNRSKSMVSKLQVPFLFGFYLKIRERKKLERKEVRARPLCHPRQPTHEPFRFTGHINASVP